MTTDSNSNIIYAGSFSYNNFLASSSSITINPNTGEINMSPTMVGSTVFGVKVEEWRNINGVPKKIGTIYRDMQVIVDNCSSSVPVLSGMDTNLTHTYNPNDTVFHLISCSNKAITFDINGYDADNANPSVPGNPEKFSISWNNGIPDALFTPFHNGTDSAFANFTWHPGYFSNYKDIQCFTVKITDEACPYNNLRSYNYCISVVKTYLYTTGDTGICQGESRLLIAHSDSNTENYKWFLDGVFTGNNLSDSTFFFDSDTLAAGTYKIEVEADNGTFSPKCPAYDYSNITVLEKPQLNIPDTVLNTPNGVVLDAGPGNYYEWRKNGFVLSFNRYFSPKTTGDYLAIVNPYITGPCNDSAYFYFDLSASIQVNEDGNFNVYPNPTNEIVFVEFNENLNQHTYFEIYDLTGKLVLKESLSAGVSKFKIDLRKLNSGAYTYKIMNNEVYRGKIVIVE